MVQIRIPPVLRAEAAGRRTVDVEAATVGEALDALVSAHPSLDGRVRQDGSVPTFLNVFVDGEDIRLLGGLETELREGSTVLLLPAVAGGSLNSIACVGRLQDSMTRSAMKPFVLLSVIACAHMA
jgi:molybdopterin converting factor small subunit